MAGDEDRKAPEDAEAEQPAKGAAPAAPEGDAPPAPPAQPAPPAPPAPARPLMSLEVKAKFLTTRRMMKTIQRIALRRSVPAQKVEDIVQQTVAIAWKADLPENPNEARKIVNKMAMIQACKLMGEEPASNFDEYRDDDPDGDDDVRAPVAQRPYDPVVRDGVERLIEIARKEFPNRADSFFEEAAKGTPAAVEAARRGVTEGHVRKERSEIRLFLRKHATKMGLVAVGVLVVVFGDISGWTRVPFMPGRSHTSDFATIHREVERIPNDPVALRARAANLCADADWEACLVDLDAAQALDPQHEETPDEARMRSDAKAELYVNDARPGMPNNSKFPLH
ncbi:MAG TPA: hypothetical protein VGG39_15855 [Polyangiaceae bacterium]